MESSELTLDAPDELAERARSGDAAAFARLYDRTWAPICRHTMRMMGRDPERARELAQETFTRAWAAIGSTAPGLRFRPWIYRIATNLCLHELEKRRPTTELDDLPDLDRDGPDARGLRADERRRVWRTLAALPPRARQVLVLRELDELGFEDIALVLGTTVGNVQVMLHRARRRFAQVLEATIPTGGDEPPTLACREFDELLGRYVDGELEPAARARLAQHLEVCAGCDAERKNQRAAAAMLAALPLLPVPGAPGWLGGGATGAGLGAAGAGATAGGTAAGGLGLSAVAAAKASAAQVVALLGLVAVTATGVAYVAHRSLAPSAGPERGSRAERVAPATPRATSPAPVTTAAALAPAPVTTPAQGPRAAPAGGAPRAPRAPRAAHVARATSAPSAAEPAPVPAPAPPDTIRQPFGRILFGQAGASRGALAIGARLRPGAVLRAPGFVAFALGDQNVLRTEPGTRLRVDREHGRTALVLEDGELWARRTSQDLHVRAGDVDVDPQGGSVRIRTSLGHTVVEALSDGVAAHVRGTMIVLGRNQAIASDATRPVPLPAPPGGMAPTAWNGTGAPRLSWDAVATARHYRLELARGADFLEVESALTTDETSARPAVTIGRHFFRVLSEDAAGHRSASSKIHSFFVEPVGP